MIPYMFTSPPFVSYYKRAYLHVLPHSHMMRHNKTFRRSNFSIKLSACVKKYNHDENMKLEKAHT